MEYPVKALLYAFINRLPAASEHLCGTGIAVPLVICTADHKRRFMVQDTEGRIQLIMQLPLVFAAPGQFINPFVC